jgi:hypothetical protein
MQFILFLSSTLHTKNYTVESIYIYIYIYIYNLCPQSSETESVENNFRILSPELPTIYLNRDIKSVSELYGQQLYILTK